MASPRIRLFVNKCTHSGIAIRLRCSCCAPVLTDSYIHLRQGGSARASFPLRRFVLKAERAPAATDGCTSPVRVYVCVEDGPLLAYYALVALP